MQKIKFINEITEGMAIYCANEDEVNLLMFYLESLGYKWDKKYDPMSNRILKTFQRVIKIGSDKCLTWVPMTESTIAFIDLIDIMKEIDSCGSWKNLGGHLFACECGYITTCATIRCPNCGKKMYQ